jgi:hypothetical protein
MITPYAEKRKAAIKNELEKKRKAIVADIRHRRYLISNKKYEYNGKNNRQEISRLYDELSKLEREAGVKIRAIDVAKHTIQDRKSKKHKWSL